MIISKKSKVIAGGLPQEVFSDLVNILKCLILYEDISHEDIIELVKDIEKERRTNEKSN